MTRQQNNWVIFIAASFIAGLVFAIIDPAYISTAMMVSGVIAVLIREGIL